MAVEIGVVFLDNIEAVNSERILPSAGDKYPSKANNIKISLYYSSASAKPE